MTRHPHLIVLANPTVLWCKLLSRLIDNTPGMIILDDSGSFSELPHLFRQVQVDWLVVTWQAEEGIAEQARLLAQREPSLSLLAISADSRCFEARFKTLQGQSQRRQFQDLKLTQLLSILRYKPGDPCVDSEIPAPPPLPLVLDFPPYLHKRIVRRESLRQVATKNHSRVK